MTRRDLEDIFEAFMQVSVMFILAAILVFGMAGLIVFVGSVLS